MRKLIPLIAILSIFFGCTDKPTSPYVITKSIKLNGAGVLDVQLYGRLTKTEMVAITSKIKKDSSQYENLQLNYLLPGNSYKNLGGVIIYATATYHELKKVTPADTVMDLHDNRFDFQFVGFTPQEAQKLMQLNPKEMETKEILGKFIDDQTKTISIVYKEGKEEEQIYILELDATGKIVSATQPLEVSHNGVQKLVISEKGDYCMLIDGTLTMYGSDNPDTPYRTLKAGI